MTDIPLSDLITFSAAHMATSGQLTAEGCVQANNKQEPEPVLKLQQNQLQKQQIRLPSMHFSFSNHSKNYKKTLGYDDNGKRGRITSGTQWTPVTQFHQQYSAPVLQRHPGF